ncbi:MAG: sensor histidine kinase [Flavobacteriales bacterium]|jgi:signal transduction histidine kinase
MVDSKEKRTLYILYILGLYILFQAGWWAYHLIDINRELYELRTITLGINHSEIYQKKVWMILGEGLIFFLLLAFGFYTIKRNVSKELRLAKREKSFLLSVTHELKTPIAAVKLFLETLRTRKLSSEQEQKIIEDALKENTRLQVLSENILLVTRLDDSRDHVFIEKVNVSDLLQNSLQRYQSLSPELVVERNIQTKGETKGDGQLLSAVFNNLIENAIKYSKKEKKIEVTLLEEQGVLVLKVKDNGIGISTDERQRIFEKFYRVGNEDTRKTKGTGLGLYIVKNIVKLHGGSVEVKSELNEGSTFTVKLPIIL